MTAPNVPPKTGWKIIANKQSLVEIIDTLMDMPATREFNKSELANHSDVSRKSIHNHIDLLVQIGIITEVPETIPTRYQFNPENEVSQALMHLDSAMNAAGPHSEE